MKSARPQKYNEAENNQEELERVKMRTVTMEQITSDLPGMIKYSLDSSDEISVASEDGAIVFLPQKDYESMKETLRLLKDKKSLKALLDSHEQMQKKQKPKSYSIEEAFVNL